MLKANSFERYMQQLVNQERAKAGVGPVKLELNLNQSAQNHSKWMLATDTFSHTGVRGTSAHERMVDADFDFSGGAGSAENLAIQTLRGAPGIKDDVYDLHVSLMNSPGHRANILNPKYDYVGISIEVGDFNYGNQVAASAIVTQNFAYTGGTVDLDNVGTTSSSSSDSPPEEKIAVPTNGADTLKGSGVVDVINGKRGDDKIYGDGNNDKLSGGSGHDLLSGGSGQDILSGNYGNDVISGGDGSDTAYGGSGKDRIKGEKHNDLIKGGWGDDVLDGGAHHDIIFGGTGSDKVFGGDGDDRLFGGSGRDIVTGGSGEDRLSGGGGHDRLSGGSWSDVLHGNRGDDTLNGGSGNDKLFGGIGADTFVFGKGNGVDIVKDFKNNIDVIDLRNMGLETVREALDSAYEKDGNAVFNFGDGDRLIVEDRSLNALADDILV